MHRVVNSRKTSVRKLCENLRDRATSIQCGVEPVLDIEPRSLVLVLFLSPDQLSIRVLGALLLDQVIGER